MRFDSLGGETEAGGVLRRIDARAKLVATLAFVIAVVSTPLRAWGLLAAEGLFLTFLVGVSGVSTGSLARRWFGFFLLFGFLAVMVAPARPERAELGVWAVALALVAKDSLAFLATLLLISVTPFHELLVAMRRLGVPTALVATLQFMYRYVFVLTDELDRMVKARRARTFRRSGRLDLGMLTGLIGVLFLRTYERGERVHAAMVARGWDGTVRSLE